MAIYINRERTHEHEQEIRSFARVKAEKYEAMILPFETWAWQAGKSSAEIEAGVQTLKDLVDYWVDRAEQGEK